MNIIKYYKGLSLLLIITAVLTLTSCKDEPDKYEVSSCGLPTVDYIRCLSSEIKGNNDAEDTHYTNGELVESASPQSTICLIGSNLRTVYEIWFNDKQAILNTSYMTDNALIVDVPRSVPKNVTDKIYLITQAKDTVKVDFKVVIPAPDIKAMSCEYAAIGDKVTFSGNYFVYDPNFPLVAAFTGVDGSWIEVPIDASDVDDEFTSVTVTIPEGAGRGPVMLTSIYGSGESPFYYLDNRGMLFDFDTPNSISNIILDMHAWNGHERTEDDGTGISGAYWQFGSESTTVSGSLEDLGWPDETWNSFAYWPGNWETPETFKAYPRLYDLVDMSDWTNMALKFEMCIPSSNPWASAAMQFVFAGTDKTTNGPGGVDIYGNTIHVQDNAYLNDPEVPRALYRPWTEKGSYDTGGKWITVSLPLTSFVYSFDGSICSESLSESSFASLWIALYGGGVEGVDCQPIIKIDNIRVVPYK